MTIELTILISVISICCTIYGVARNAKRDVKADAAESTTVLIKLEGIQSGVNEIKQDIKSVKTDVRDLQDKVARVEESTKSAHKRIDEWHHIDTRSE